MKEQQFVVGGSVRDVLLGYIPRDIDYVWESSSIEHMHSLGFSQVGSAFPVFLDQYGNEHALARTERKTGVGYLQFKCDTSDVSLKDDLMRRDLTINSLAVPINDWLKFVETRDVTLVIDPYGGIRDLHDGLLRHTSPAFSEDSIRILRTARFAARYDGFIIARSTLKLMGDIAPELDHVPQERIWAEFEKGLAEDRPIKMFEALRDSEVLFQSNALEPYALLDWGMLANITNTTSMCARFVACAHNFKKEDYDRCRIPLEFSRVAQAFFGVVQDLCYYQFRDAKARIEMLNKLRAFSSPQLLDAVLDVWKLYYVRGFDPRVAPLLIRKDMELLSVVDTAGIASSCTNGKEIAGKLLEARIAALTSR